MGKFFQTFSQKALTVMVYAQEEAIRFDSNFVSSEHLLIALADSKESSVATMLAEHGFSINQARQLITEIGYERLRIRWFLPQFLKIWVRRLKATPFSKNMVSILRSTEDLGLSTVEPGHLFLVLLDTAPSKVLTILESQNISVEELRTAAASL